MDDVEDPAFGVVPERYSTPCGRSILLKRSPSHRDGGIDDYLAGESTRIANRLRGPAHSDPSVAGTGCCAHGPGTRSCSGCWTGSASRLANLTARSQAACGCRTAFMLALLVMSGLVLSVGLTA